MAVELGPVISEGVFGSEVFFKVLEEYYSILKNCSIIVGVLRPGGPWADE
jgi:hypothetical protein